MPHHEPYHRGTSVLCMINNDDSTHYIEGKIINHCINKQYSGIFYVIQLSKTENVLEKELHVSLMDILPMVYRINGYIYSLFEDKNVELGHRCVCKRTFLPQKFNSDIAKCIMIQCSNNECTNMAVNFSGHSLNLFIQICISFTIYNKFKDAKPMCPKHLINCHQLPIDQCICADSPSRIIFEKNLLSLRQSY